MQGEAETQSDIARNTNVARNVEQENESNDCIVSCDATGVLMDGEVDRFLPYK